MEEAAERLQEPEAQLPVDVPQTLHGKCTHVENSLTNMVA